MFTNRGQFDVQQDTIININGLGPGGTGQFNNHGSMVFTGPGTTNVGSIGTVTFNNTGSVDVQSGTVELNDAASAMAPPQTPLCSRSPIPHHFHCEDRTRSTSFSTIAGAGRRHDQRRELARYVQHHWQHDRRLRRSQRYGYERGGVADSARRLRRLSQYRSNHHHTDDSGISSELNAGNVTVTDFLWSGGKLSGAGTTTVTER